MKKFFRHLNYKIKFLLVNASYLFVVLSLALFLLYTQQKQTTVMHLEMIGQQYNEILQILIEQVTDHLSLAERYISQSIKYDKLTAVQKKIDDTFQELINLQNEKKFLNIPVLESKKLDIQLLHKEWKEIKKQSKNWLSIEISSDYHNTLINQLFQLIRYVANTSLLILDNDIETNYSIKMLIENVPKLEIQIPKLNILISGVLTRQNITDDETLSLLKLSIALENQLADLDGIVQNIQSISNLENAKGTNDVQVQLVSLANVIKQLTTYLKDSIIGHETLPQDANDFLAITSQITSKITALRDVATKRVNFLLESRYSKIRTTQFIIIATVTASILFSVIIAFLVIDSIRISLQNLMNVTRDFAAGMLSRRVTEISNDDIGQLGLAFNSMAESLQISMEHLQTTGKQLSQSTEELTNEMQSQVTTITEQEAATKEMSSTVKQIVENMQHLVDTMDSVTKQTTETSDLATGGHSNLLQVRENIYKLVGMSNDISSKLDLLNSSSKGIVEIIVTITNVVDQTNLLSLNASLSAENAGEFSAGFAIIASEIRRLADRTANATLGIEKMINEMSQAIITGTEAMNKFAQEFASTVTYVDRVLDQISEMILKVQSLGKNMEYANSGIPVQFQAIEEINQTLEHFSSRMVVSATAVRKVSETIQSLENKAKELNEMKH